MAPHPVLAVKEPWHQHGEDVVAGIAAGLAVTTGRDEERMARVLRQALALSGSKADIKQALQDSLVLVQSNSFPGSTSSVQDEGSSLAGVSPEQRAGPSPAPQATVEASVCNLSSQCTVPAAEPAQTKASSAEKEALLAKLLNPALAKAMLADGTTPDAMTRLRHGLAKSHGYTGKLEGWTVQINRKEVAVTSQPAAGGTPTQAATRLRTEIAWVCPGFPKCRSIPEVARALKLAPLQPGGTQSKPAPAPTAVQLGQVPRDGSTPARSQPATRRALPSANASAQRLDLSAACQQLPGVWVVPRVIASAALQPYLLPDEASRRVMLTPVAPAAAAAAAASEHTLSHTSSAAPAEPLSVPLPGVVDTLISEQQSLPAAATQLQEGASQTVLTAAAATTTAVAETSGASARVTPHPALSATPAANPVDPPAATPAPPCPPATPEPLPVHEALRLKLVSMNLIHRQHTVRQQVLAHSLTHRAGQAMKAPEMEAVVGECMAAHTHHHLQEAATARTARWESRTQAVLQWHVSAAEEMARRREAARRVRLNALRSSDMEAYLALVRETRSERLQAMLDQTQECLNTLAARLGITGLLAPTAAGQQDQRLGQAAAGSSDVVAVSEAWSQLASRLIADIPHQPALLSGGQLREYQMHGVRWMAALHQAGLGGILADDMGLGKTVQVIALVCHLVEAQAQASSSTTRGSPALPFLIAAPASVLPNWAAEFARWAPAVKVVVYRGGPEAREQVFNQQMMSRRPGAPPPFHVLLTSYDFLMGKADKPRLTRFSWSHVIIDEGHRLKDASCRLARELAHYKTKSRLLLTGTPLQNRLQELWSLLHFLLPGSFGPAEDFDRWFTTPLDALRGAEPGGAGGAGSDAAGGAGLTEEEFMLATNRLHQVLRPFVLRRLLSNVAGELPGKEERVVRCSLTPYQAALNQMVRSRALGSEGCSLGSVSVQNTVMELRKIANHPLLSALHPAGGEEMVESPSGLPACITTSSKMELLDRLLLRLHSGGHKVLLFSTMTQCLDLIEEVLDWRGLLGGSRRLDGNTAAADRADLIAQFNKQGGSAPWLFLLSVRAGGVGLNLQAADTVIMYDTDWNPQIDLQAQARAHRLGQTNKVLVLRLLTACSIEEHISRVAQDKLRFAESSITGGFFDGQTSDEDRRSFLMKLLQDSAPAAGLPAGGGGPQGGGAESEPQQQTGCLSDAEVDALLARHTPPAAAAASDRQALLSGRSTGTSSCPPAACLVPNRLLTADQSACLISHMQQHNQVKDPDAGKIWGRGMRAANTLLTTTTTSQPRPGQLPTPSAAVPPPAQAPGEEQAAGRGTRRKQPRAGADRGGSKGSESQPGRQLGRAHAPPATNLSTPKEALAGCASTAASPMVPPSPLTVHPAAIQHTEASAEVVAVVQDMPNAPPEAACSPPGSLEAIAGGAGGRDVSEAGLVTELDMDTQVRAVQLAGSAATDDECASSPALAVKAPGMLACSAEQGEAGSSLCGQVPPLQSPAILATTAAESISPAVIDSPPPLHRPNVTGSPAQVTQDRPGVYLRPASSSSPPGGSGKRTLAAAPPAPISQHGDKKRKRSNEGGPEQPDMMAKLRKILHEKFGFQGSLSGWTCSAVYGKNGKGGHRWYPTFHHPNHPECRSFLAVGTALKLKLR